MWLIGKYFELRFSHWNKGDRRKRKREVIRKLKQSTDVERARYAQDVEAFLETNGYDHKQHQG
jgi:hypothetical protein